MKCKIIGGSVGIALFTASAVSAAPMGFAAQRPFRTAAVMLKLAAGDVAPHQCQSGYLLSVEAVDETTGRVAITAPLSPDGSAAGLGVWVNNATGFKLASGAPHQVSVLMICGRI